MTRPSNRELKVLSRLETGGTTAPDDFADVGERTFSAMVTKGWITPVDANPDKVAFIATPKGLVVHLEELYRGRWKR